MAARRIRIVSEDGLDYAAWAIGAIAVIKVDPERSREGRQWFVWDGARERLAETSVRATAFRIAECWDRGEEWPAAEADAEGDD